MKIPSAHTFRWMTVSAAGLFALAAVHAQVASQPAVQAEVDTPAASVSAPAESFAAGVRIVRLSETRGEVKMDRAVGHGYEPAFENLPIVQGAKLKTDNGVAEVEFEDNSTLRLTPDAVVEFSGLSRDAAGHTVTSVNVLHGTVYASLSDAKANAFLISSAQGRLTLAPSTHMQFNTAPGGSTLAVYKGSVVTQVGSSLFTVDQKKTLRFGAPGVVQPELVSHLEKGSYDDWDKTSVDYHKRYMNSFQTTQTTGAGFMPIAGISSGLNDLGYYGVFADRGCGNLWSPYFADASFDPYANGIYAQYAGGYSWVSPYPWGWLPYHSGSWEYCNTGAGGGSWGWRPGNTYVGLGNTLLPVKPGRGPVRVGPPHLPVAAKASLVPVQRQPLVVSKLAGNDSFVFTKGSAGLGIPRQTFGNLQHAAMHAEQHGTASASISLSRAESTGYALSGGSGVNRSVSPGADRGVVSAGRGAVSGGPVSGPSGYSGAISMAGVGRSSGGVSSGAASSSAGASHH